MLKNLRRAATAALVAAAAVAALLQPAAARAAPLQACFVYVSPVGQAAVTAPHLLGAGGGPAGLSPAVALGA